MVAAAIVVSLLLATFIVLEPTVGRSQASDIFTVSQQITGEISITASTSDVTMDANILGLTGGHATGSTQVVVTTNNATGYKLELSFASTTAMYRDGGSGEIENYSPAVVTVPDYDFDDTEIFGQFAYTVSASTSLDVDQSFEDNGTLCNVSGSVTVDKCWLNPSTTAEQIVLTSAATPVSGSTSTVQFRVTVPNAPSPAIPTGTYTATATLTATTN